MFTASIDARWTEPVLLIQAAEVPTGPRVQKDIDLSLYRLRMAPRAESILVSARAVVRGVLLVKDTSSPHDVFVVDLVDTDMFLRLKKLFALSI